VKVQAKSSSILLIENNPTLRDLNEMILDDAGYHVRVAPRGEDPESYAAGTEPDVIVLSVGPTEASEPDLVDRFRSDERTAKIPIVVISSTERSAVQAQASSNVRETVVMPYDIDALRDAVARALGNPPPVAALPEPTASVSPAIEVAADVLIEHNRRIMLRALERLRQEEPFRSRFGELSPGLIDDLPTILGALTGALQRGLPPKRVAAIPEVREAVCRHVRLRQSQGLASSIVAREYFALLGEMLRVLEEECDRHQITAANAFAVAATINALATAALTTALDECGADR
jgi:CheY-like chemotaxis protein